MIIAFCIPGQPVAKGRPRFVRRGNHVATYSPEKTVNYESLVKMAAHYAMSDRKPLDTPIEINVFLWMQIPASWSKKKRQAAVAGTVHATSRPDSDNIAKGIFDGCNGIVWKDDAQLVTINIQKKYAESPRADVVVSELAGVCA